MQADEKVWNESDRFVLVSAPELGLQDAGLRALAANLTFCD
jgi:hypothetical protein